MFKHVNDSRGLMKDFFTQALESYTPQDNTRLKSQLRKAKKEKQGVVKLGSLFTGCGGQDEAIKARPNCYCFIINDI